MLFNSPSKIISSFCVCGEKNANVMLIMKTHLLYLQYHRKKPKFKAGPQYLAILEDPFWRSCCSFKQTLMSSEVAGFLEGR